MSPGGYHPSMRLPNVERAEVDLRKLREYCLSRDHPVGKHKATVFQAALGLTAADAEVLQNWLLQAATLDEAVVGQADEFGQRFQIDFEITTKTGSAAVRSAWIVLAGEDFPRLTTCYVLQR